MAVPSTPLTIDITNSDRVGLLHSFDARNLISSPLFVRNDGNPIALRLCRPSTSGVRVFDDFDPTDYTVSLAIGEPDEVPTAGTWQLTSGANTTAALAADISATDLQTALNLLAGVDVTVASSAPGLFVVTFTTLGAQTLLTAPANSLNPTSNVIVSRVVTGTASTYEVQIVRLVLVPYALNETWTPFASADSDITTLVAGDVDTYQVDVVTLDPRPYAGTFTIDDSDPIAYNATAAQVQAALGDCTVSGNQGGPWTITSTVFGAISRTVDVAGLTVPIGLDGTLNLNTYSMLQRFLQTTDSVITLTLEVQLRSTVPGSKPVTVMQLPVRVSRDVIDTDSLLPAPVGDYYTAAEVDTLLAGAVPVDPSEPTKMDPSFLPEQIDVRLQVLGGSEAALAAETIGEHELVVNTTTKRIEYGDGSGNRVDPLKEYSMEPAVILSKAGDALIGGLAVLRPVNPGIGYFATRLANAAGANFTLRTTTGYARLINPDGSLGAQAGTGNATSNIDLTIPAGSGLRAFGFISVANGGSVRSGNVTYLNLPSNQLTSIDLTGLTALTYLNLYNSQLTSIDLTGLTALTALNLNNNQLTSIDLTGLTALTYLALNNNQLTSIDLTGLTALTYLDLNNNQITSLTGMGAIGGSYKFYGQLSGNALSTTALNDFYTQLRSDPPGGATFDVSGNPGTGSDNPAIATAKGWTINGS